jgi:hypothetical protein
MSLDEALKKLRYVKRWPEPESEVRHEDLNTKVDALKAIRDVVKSKVGEDPLIDELGAIMRRIPYVKAGDIVEPEHHNLIVDAMWKVRDLLAKIEEKYKAMIWRRLITPPIWGVDGGVDDMVLVCRVGFVWEVIRRTILPKMIPPLLWGIHCGCLGVTTGECILYAMLNLRDANFLGDEVGYY